MFHTNEAGIARTSPVARQQDTAVDHVPPRLYVREYQKCHLAYVYERLLLLTHRLGAPTAAVIRVYAGFNCSFSLSARHREDRTGVRMVIVEMLAGKKQAQRMLEPVASETPGLTRHFTEYSETPYA
jgi:hypothetical protein